MKKLISIIIAVTIALSVFALPTAANAAQTENVVKKTIMQYKQKNLTFSKNEDDSYDCKVENNDEEFIKVDAYNEGDHYWLMVTTLKPTEGATPKITVTDSKDGSVVKCWEFTVTPAKKVAMKDVKFNVNTTNDITIKNPYCKDYTLKYDKKILKYKWANISGSKCIYTFICKKKGTTTVKAYIKGTLYGSFKVTVGDFKASIKKSYKKQTIKYNKHIKSYNFTEGGSVDLAEAVKYFHSDATYTVKIKNKKIAASRTLKADKEYQLPKRAEIYSLKPGKTTADVYEQRGKSKKTKIGTIALTVKKVKYAQVAETNMTNDNDGIFYEFFITPGDKVDLKKIVVGRYVNGSVTAVKFKNSEYTFTVKAGPEEVLTVDKDGIITCLGYDGDGKYNSVSYTVKFADGSKVSGSGSFDIVEPDSLS